jgi:hypothetical protein
MSALLDVFSFRLPIISDLLRNLFLFIDGIIYGLLGPVYKVAMNLVDLSGFFDSGFDTGGIASKVAGNIYVFLALAMFFKLAFSIITMIANPDMVSDKQKGLSKIFTHAIVTVILVVIMPTVFDMAYGIQELVIKGTDGNNGILKRIFLDTGTGVVVGENEGDVIARGMFAIFVGKNPDVELDEETSTALDQLKQNGIKALSNKGAITSHTGGLFGTEYRLYYMSIISTIVGVMLLISFIKMTIEIALRSIKLLIIEIISPIAIISYLDPASASKGIFARWSSTAIKVYISLFIRLSILFLMTNLIVDLKLENYADAGLSSDIGVFEVIFIMLAIIAFMQTAPKFLEELLGYKPSEDGKAISGIVGAGIGVGAAAAGMVGGYAMRKHDEKKLQDDPSWTPGKFRQFNDKRKEIFGDLKAAGSGGAQAGAKGGVLQARHTSDKLAYKQRRGQLDKQINENVQKKKGFDRMDSQSVEREAEYTDLVNGFQASYAGDATYNSYVASGQRELADEYKETQAKKFANSKMYSETYAKKKNLVLDNQFKSIVLGQKQAMSQSNTAMISQEINSLNDQITKLEIDRSTATARGASAAEIANYTTMIDSLNTKLGHKSAEFTREQQESLDVSFQLQDLDATIKGITSQVEALSKDPNFSEDAALDARIKQGKALK